MRTLYSLIVISIILNGCVVSKKKYEASMLENSQLNKKLEKAIEENTSLEKRINNNIAEFEAMKNELHLSNAIKSDEMSDLLVKVTKLTDLNNELEGKLEETLKLYKTQKQNSISTVGELKNLRTNNIKLARDTASLKYALKLSRERFSKLEDELNTQKNKYNQLYSNNQQLNTNLESNKQKLASFEQQLVRNKEKMEVISKALIELRKQMLSAKSSNKTIDPNKNKHIDKMAKTLGHY